MSIGLDYDALRSTPDGFTLRVVLPWIRSLPLSGLSGLSLEVDDRPVQELIAVVGGRRVEPGALAHETVWWHLQDRLVLAGSEQLTPGAHAVCVEFSLLVPYLPGGPGVPLVLPFRLQAELELDRPAAASVAGEVGGSYGGAR